MGVDCVIYFQATGDVSDLYLASEFKISPIPDNDMKDDGLRVGDDHPGATHEIGTCCRYYGPGYERGSWPLICGALMKIHAHPNIDKVWYGGDSSWQQPLCSIDTVLDISRHYMLNGHRPYDSHFKTADK